MAQLLFLGGTVGNNPWRQHLINVFQKHNIDMKKIFNPVVKDWNEEAQKREEEMKKKASHLLFFLGSPFQLGIPLSAYSMVEATMALYDRPKDTVIVFEPDGIVGHSLKSYKQTERVLRARFPKANIFSSLNDASNWLVKELK